MTPPILLFAYADARRGLQMLRGELEAIAQCLLPLENRGFVRADVLHHSDIGGLLRKLADPEYGGRLALFHFSGHAGDEELLFADAAGLGKGLAQLLGECPALKLVFLNGCSTRGHVQALLEHGVQAVVATAAPVFDDMAHDFSVAFYQALANKRTLGGAFAFARQALESRYRQTPGMGMHRGVSFEEEPGPVEYWGLYLQANAAADGDGQHWRLPYYRSFELPAAIRAHISTFQSNKHLAAVLGEMCRYNKDIYTQMVEVRNGAEIPRDSSTFLDLVIQNFPWVIGSQIQLLRQERQPGPARLRLLVGAYLRLGQVLYYILLSDYWEAIHHRRLSPPSGSLDELLVSGEESCRAFPFFQKAGRIAGLMHSGGAPFFMPELELFFEEARQPDSLPAKAIGYFESLRQGPPQADKASECGRAEQALGFLLRQAAFFANYQMLTVRNIRLEHPRFSRERYDLEHGRLHAIVDTSLALYADELHRIKNTYAHSESVVLAHFHGELTDYLNLSPFIVDVNTFLRNEQPDLFLFGYEKGGACHFLKANHSFYDTLDNRNGLEVMDTTLTFDAYREGLNDRNRQAREDGLFGLLDGLDGATAPAAGSPRVFALLEEQFALLKSDFATINPLAS